MPTVVPEAGKPFPCPSPERIAQIAQWLPDKPTGIGPHASERALWERLAKSPKTQEIISKAEKYLAEPRPELKDELYHEFLQNGNRTHYQEVFFKRTSRLTAFAVAELLEFKGRFLPALKSDLAAICDAKSWVLPAHDPKLLNFNNIAPYADLTCSHICLELAIIDWLFGDLLGSNLRKRLRDEVEHRAYHTYRNVIRTGVITDYQWWTIGDENWNAVCNNGVISSALIFLESKQERAEFIAAAEQSANYFASGFTPDGYCSEGMGYWNYGFGNFLNLAETILIATDRHVNFLDKPIFRKVAAFARDILIEPGCCPAFADCHPKAAPAPDTTAFIQRHFPDVILTPVPPLDSPRLELQTMILRAIGDIQIDEKTNSSTLPPRSYFPDAGIYVGRSETRFGCAHKMGRNNEHHNHNDIGSFCVSLRGHQYFLDPGNEIYTYRTFSERRYEGQMLNSYGHMVPVVAGTLQPPGGNIYGTFTHTEFTPERDTLVSDMKTAYPDAQDLVSLKRTFVFDRKAQSITVRDDVEFSTPQTFETALVSFDKLEQTSANAIVSSDDDGSIAATVSSEGGTLKITFGEIDNPNATNPKRVALAFTEPVLKASITVIFHA